MISNFVEKYPPDPTGKGQYYQRRSLTKKARVLTRWAPQEEEEGPIEHADVEEEPQEHVAPATQASSKNKRRMTDNTMQVASKRPRVVCVLAYSCLVLPG
jgi:hypothetical protein